MDKKALITGIAGQDGSYLAEFLLSKSYEVHGLMRWDSASTTQRIDHLISNPEIYGKKLFLHHGNITDTGNVTNLIRKIKPAELYHLAAMSHVRVSFDMPEYTANADGVGTLRVLEAIKNSGLPVKFYMAASSEMFGDAPDPQNEETSFNPQSPYACSKVFSYHVTRLYRKAYKLFAANGIFYNHESPRRGETFVTRKITRSLARIKSGKDKKLYLGNLEAKRDWGYAPEYIEAMWIMLQHSKADDFVLATDENHSVKEFLEEAFKYVGLGNWQQYVEIDPKLFRPAEVEYLIGDSRKAKEKLGWEPKVKFKDLVRIMIDSDFRANKVEPPGEGDKILKELFPNRWWKID